ncbi:MAG: lipopolysaccharide biosynthesis protein [Gammaproteobacteria bacterium]
MWSPLKALAASDFSRKTAHSLLTRFALLGSEFVVNVLVARVLGPEGRGLFAVANALSGAITQVGMLGLHNANTYFLARGGIAQGVLTANSLLIAVGIGLAGLCGAGAVALWAPEWLPVTGLLLLLALFNAPVQLLQFLLLGLLQGAQRVYRSNHIEVVARVTQIVLVGGLILAGILAPESLLAVAVVAAGLGAALAWFSLSSADSRLRVCLADLRTSLGYGLKSYASAVLGFLVLRTDVLLINWFLGSEQTGQYAVAVTLINGLYVLPTTLSHMAFIKLVSVPEWADRLRLVIRVCGLSALLMTLTVLGAAWAASGIFPLLFGEAFAGAAGAFVCLLPGLWIWSIETVIRKLYTTDGYASWVVWAWACAFLTNIVLNIVLIPRMGIVGAAMASSIALGVVALWTFIAFLRDPRRRVARAG